MRKVRREAWSLTCTIPADQREVADGLLVGTRCQGCHEVDVFGGVQMTWYFPSHEALQAAEYRLMKLPLLSSISVKFVPEQDWNEAWRQSLSPAYLGYGMWVSPEWRHPRLAPGERWIKIEPKMAFGTGHHESTRLAAGAMALSGDVGGGAVLDIGTGSGVLSFVADICGAVKVVGIEIDDECMTNLAENRQANPCAANLGFVIGSLDALRSHPEFDVAVMNMLLNESVPLLGQVAGLLRDEGILIWSGLLAEEIEQVLAAANRAGFALADQATDNEWWCGTFRRC